MDPDLDPNLQHWQDRLDSFQWVVGSLVVGARQHPDLTLSPDDTRALRAVVLTLLAVDGVISAVLAAFFLPLRLGPVPFPISALISGLLNAALVWAALQWTSSPRLAALPLWTWLATVAGLTFPGPGDDAVFSAEWRAAAADRRWARFRRRCCCIGATGRASAYSSSPAALSLAASRASFAACRTSLTTFLAVSPKLLATVVGAFVTSSAALLGLPGAHGVDDVVYRLGDRTAHLTLSPDDAVGWRLLRSGARWPR